MPQGRDSRAPATATRKTEQLPSNLSPRITFFPSLARFSCVVPPVSLCLQALRTCRQQPICGRSIACPCGLPTNKECGPAALRREPAHQKKRRLLAQENTRRHAWLSRSCFGRVVFQHRRPAFTTTLFPFSFFTKEKKKENRSKFSRFEYIARTHFVRPHDVRDWPVAPRPLKFM